MNYHEDDVNELLRLYGKEADPIWNSQMRKALEASLSLSSYFKNEQFNCREGAKLFLAYPQLATLALESLGVKNDSEYSILNESAVAITNSVSFQDPIRFLTPKVTCNLKPLIEQIAFNLGIEPQVLWPEGYQETVKPVIESKESEVLKTYLNALEPYASLKEVVLIKTSVNGKLFWPLYDNELMVFGGAQYFMGIDGGMLCVPSVYTFEEVENAYLTGERCSLEPPVDLQVSHETWARNCGAAARAVVEALNGSTEAAAVGVLGHWENGQFADGETLGVMLKALEAPLQPPLVNLSTVPEVVKQLKTGDHLVVGIRWKNWNKGHWFNVRNDGSSTQWIDGQTGHSGMWPPPFLNNAEPLGMVIKPVVTSKRRWKLG